MGSTVSKWGHNYCTRRALAEVESYLLEDMGLTKSDVDKEVGKPFWK
ncbi:MAG: DUF1127 domain-containing protein [Proteobacteria bacterium]|nr:DUF1127 domain-containing protein [Pseudomonadota bacterium]